MSGAVQHGAHTWVEGGTGAAGEKKMRASCEGGTEERAKGRKGGGVVGVCDLVVWEFIIPGEARKEKIQAGRQERRGRRKERGQGRKAGRQGREGGNNERKEVWLGCVT